MTYIDTYGFKRDAEGRLDFSEGRAAWKVYQEATRLRHEQNYPPRPPKTNFPEKRELETLEDYWRRRNTIIMISRRDGVSLDKIAKRFDLTRERIRQIAFRRERQEKSLLRRRRSRHVLTRPIDMGGPRDIWLTFTPEYNP